MEHNIKWEMTGGTPILGNFHVKVLLNMHGFDYVALCGHDFKKNATKYSDV